ncbi:hypothetical protein YC2023_106934 [Brassica napus]
MASFKAATFDHIHCGDNSFPPIKLSQYFRQIDAALHHNSFMHRYYLILNLKLHAFHHKICHSLALLHPIIDPGFFLFTAAINTASISDLCAGIAYKNNIGIEQKSVQTSNQTSRIHKTTQSSSYGHSSGPGFNLKSIESNPASFFDISPQWPIIPTHFHCFNLYTREEDSRKGRHMIRIYAELCAHINYIQYHVYWTYPIWLREGFKRKRRVTHSSAHRCLRNVYRYHVVVYDINLFYLSLMNNLFPK